MVDHQNSMRQSNQGHYILLLGEIVWLYGHFKFVCWFNRFLCPSINWPSHTAILGFMNSLVDAKGVFAALLLPIERHDNINQHPDLIHGSISTPSTFLTGWHFDQQWWQHLHSTLWAESSSFLNIILSQYVLVPSVDRLTLVSSRIKSYGIQAK